MTHTRSTIILGADDVSKAREPSQSHSSNRVITPLEFGTHHITLITSLHDLIKFSNSLENEIKKYRLAQIPQFTPGQVPVEKKEVKEATDEQVEA